MELAEELLEILVCPESKQPLIYFAEEGFLLCPESRLKYRIEDAIPVMLVDEADRLSADEVARLVRQAEERAAPRTGPRG